MHITVFGAAGWLGRACLANLAGRHDVRAVDLDDAAWEKFRDIDGPTVGEEVVHVDIRDYEGVDRAIADTNAVLHLTAAFPSQEPAQAEMGFGVNVRGLWNVLESCHRRDIRRIVHVGSCQVAHPNGEFFESDVRRPDGSLYAVTKRLQEEMCRQFHEAFGTSIVVLRPASIEDSRLGIRYNHARLGEEDGALNPGSVCRHDLAEACRLALESKTIDFDILHIVGMPEADETCNAARAREVLKLTCRGNLEQYR
ncbi:MAG: hypothetical protein CMJ18_11380 [Phycisphaeraceae bacterium]|nr:hypothetical protein [Phycisphaeraceae bacterium]